MFVLVEGIDGVGKTTLCKEIKELFESLDKTKPCFSTYEPFGKYRETLKSEKAKKLTEFQITKIFLECREEHQQLFSVVEKSGANIVCDRYILSNMAYQKCFSDYIWNITINCDFAIPDLTILLLGEQFVQNDPNDQFESLDKSIIETNFENLYVQYREALNIKLFKRQSTTNKEILDYVEEQYNLWKENSGEDI